MINSHSLRYLPGQPFPSLALPTSIATAQPSSAQSIYTHLLALTKPTADKQAVTMILTDLVSMLFRLAEVWLHPATNQATLGTAC